MDPDQAYTLAEYQAAAYAAIEDIFARGKQPLLVGGTGLYVRAVTEGLIIPAVPPNPSCALNWKNARRVKAAIVVCRTPADRSRSRTKIDPRNVRRTIRALEVYWATGQKFSAAGQAAPPPFAVQRIGLTLPREELYRRVMLVSTR